MCDDGSCCGGGVCWDHVDCGMSYTSIMSEGTNALGADVGMG